MTASKRIRLLIADARPVFRMGIKMLLEKENDIQIVGETDQADQVMKKIASLKPNVLLLHARLSEIEERSILRQIHRTNSGLRLFILVSSDHQEDQIKALRLSAAHIVPRHAQARQLLQWIRQEESADAGAKDDGMTALPPGDGKPREPARKDSSPLSSRERQVVELVSQGFKNREIAQRMFISEQTVKNHLHNIFDKLGVSDRLELALYAIHKNLQVAD